MASHQAAGELELERVKLRIGDLTAIAEAAVSRVEGRSMRWKPPGGPPGRLKGKP